MRSLYAHPEYIGRMVQTPDGIGYVVGGNINHSEYLLIAYDDIPDALKGTTHDGLSAADVKYHKNSCWYYNIKNLTFIEEEPTPQHKYLEPDIIGREVAIIKNLHVDPGPDLSYYDMVHKYSDDNTIVNAKSSNCKDMSITGYIVGVDKIRNTNLAIWFPDYRYVSLLHTKRQRLSVLGKMDVPFHTTDPLMIIHRGRLGML